MCNYISFQYQITGEISYHIKYCYRAKWRKKHLPVTKYNGINVKITMKPYFVYLQSRTGFED